jgi:hypothetical protein
MKGIHLTDNANGARSNDLDRLALEAARQALARNWPNLEASNPKYAAMVDQLPTSEVTC